MTLDVISFIDSKGGNAEEIRESQRKRGESVELVDEVIQMYAEWVKRMSILFFVFCCVPRVYKRETVDFDVNGLNKQVNGVQKEIAAKKKVLVIHCWCWGPVDCEIRQKRMQTILWQRRKT